MSFQFSKKKKEIQKDNQVRQLDGRRGLGSGEGQLMRGQGRRANSTPWGGALMGIRRED